MSKIRLAKEIKRHAVINSFAKKCFDLEIVTFLKLNRSFTFNLKGKMKAARFHGANVSFRK